MSRSFRATERIKKERGGGKTEGRGRRKNKARRAKEIRWRKEDCWRRKRRSGRGWRKERFNEEKI